LSVCFSLVEPTISGSKNTTTFIPKHHKRKFLMVLNKGQGQLIDNECNTIQLPKRKIKNAILSVRTFLLRTFAAKNGRKTKDGGRKYPSLKLQA